MQTLVFLNSVSELRNLVVRVLLAALDEDLLQFLGRHQPVRYLQARHIENPSFRKGRSVLTVQIKNDNVSIIQDASVALITGLLAAFLDDLRNSTVGIK